MSPQSETFNRFTPDGRHDGSIVVEFGYQRAKALEIAADEKIIVGGSFTQIYSNGVSVSRKYLVRLMPQPVPIRRKYDFDGDGKDDPAVFRPGDQVWYINQSTNGFAYRQFGLSTDKPVAADYDGDGRADHAVFRPSTGVWWIQRSTKGLSVVRWGFSDDLPVPADYDGDGKTDIAVYRNGVWYILKSTGSYHIEQFGLSGDIPAQLKP